MDLNQEHVLVIVLFRVGGWFNLKTFAHSYMNH